MVGWAIDFPDSSDTIKRQGVPEKRWCGYLLRIDGELRWFGPNQRTPVCAGGPGVDPDLPGLPILCPSCGELQEATDTTLVHAFCASRERASLSALTKSERDDFVSFVAWHQGLAEEWLEACEFPLRLVKRRWDEPRQARADARKVMWACNQCLLSRRALFGFDGRPSAYTDLRGICTQCSRPYLFEKEEQQHYSERLGFDTAPVRCLECRSGGPPKSHPRAQPCEVCARSFVPPGQDDGQSTSAASTTAYPYCFAWKNKADKDLEYLLSIANPNWTVLLHVRDILQGLGDLEQADRYHRRALAAPILASPTSVATLGARQTRVARQFGWLSVLDVMLFVGVYGWAWAHLHYELDHWFFFAGVLGFAGYALVRVGTEKVQRQERADEHDHRADGGRPS
jgi:hypothetical protein